MALSFALARAGHSDGQLDTRAEVTLDKDGDGFAVTRSALTPTAKVPGIAAEAFATIAAEAKAGCPISKLLNCEKIGRAHVATPVTHAHLVCRLLLEYTNITSI